MPGVGLCLAQLILLLTDTGAREEERSAVTNNASMWTEAAMDMWGGRVDDEPDTLRWHQVVRKWDAADNRSAVAVLGFACDAGVARNKGRVGAAKGPLAIRKALCSLAWHNDGHLIDAGDVTVKENAHLEEGHKILSSQVRALLDAGHFPVVLGGGNEVSFGSFEGITQHLVQTKAVEKPVIGVINLDAHFDLRADPMATSGTPFYQISQACDERDWPFRYLVMGISEASNTKALFNRADQLGVEYVLDHQFSHAEYKKVEQRLLKFLSACDYVYLTIDLDVFPACEAPGVSAPAARGTSIVFLEPLITQIRDSGKLVMADLAELNPQFDIDARTAKLAARLVYTITRRQQ